MILAENVPGEHGGDYKNRYGVVLLQHGDAVYVAISTTKADGRVDKIPVPWGKPSRTCLPERSVVACRWRVKVERERILAVGGFLPGKCLAQITEWIRADIERIKREARSGGTN